MASNVPITELQGQIPIRRKGNKKCSVHRNKDVILHCTDCNFLVCLSCSISTHNGHILTEISDMALQKKDVLQDFIHDVEGRKLILLQNKMQSIDKEISENDKNFKELGQQVKTQGELCKKEIDVLTDEFVSICDRLEKENRDLLMQYKEELQERHKSLLEQVKECKEILQTGTDVLVCDSASDLSADFFSAKAAPVLHEAEFHPCTEITEQLRKTLGMLNTSSGHPNVTSGAIAKLTTLQEEFEDEPIVLTIFKSPIDCTTICPNTSGAWLCDNESNVLLSIDAKGQIKQNIKYPYGNIVDISTSQTGSLWFCCRENCNISEVPASSLVPITRFEADSWPICICITQEGYVAVGTRNTKEPEGKLIIYTTVGQLLSSSSANKKGSELGTPHSISECSVTGNFAVNSRDQESDDGSWSRRIIVYDKELKFKFEICEDGSEEKSVKSSFCPRCAVYDSRGHLLIDLINVVQVLNGTGQYLRTIYVHDENSAIVTIGVRPDDALWVHFYKQKLEKRGMFGKLLRKRPDSVCKSEIKIIKYYKD